MYQNQKKTLVAYEALSRVIPSIDPKRKKKKNKNSYAFTWRFTVEFLDDSRDSERERFHSTVCVRITTHAVAHHTCLRDVYCVSKCNGQCTAVTATREGRLDHVPLLRLY